MRYNQYFRFSPIPQTIQRHKKEDKALFSGGGLMPLQDCYGPFETSTAVEAKLRALQAKDPQHSFITIGTWLQNKMEYYIRAFKRINW